MSKRKLVNDHDGAPWIGVDLDGTLAYYEGWKRWDLIGDPLEPMASRVRAWINEGKIVKIMTARVTTDNFDVFRDKATGKIVGNIDVISNIQRWTLKHLGSRLPVTCVKDLWMIELWDDRAIQMVPNTGRTLADHHEAEMMALKGKP